MFDFPVVGIYIHITRPVLFPFTSQHKAFAGCYRPLLALLYVKYTEDKNEATLKKVIMQSGRHVFKQVFLLQYMKGWTILPLQKVVHILTPEPVKIVTEMAIRIWHVLSN